MAETCETCGSPVEPTPGRGHDWGQGLPDWRFDPQAAALLPEVREKVLTWYWQTKPETMADVEILASSPLVQRAVIERAVAGLTDERCREVYLVTRSARRALQGSYEKALRAALRDALLP